MVNTTNNRNQAWQLRCLAMVVCVRFRAYPARSMLQWGLRFSTEERPRPVRRSYRALSYFNGASAFQRRKGLASQRVIGQNFRQHAACSCSSRNESGSSPRVQGTLSPCPPHSTIIRFIPACAGNTGVGNLDWRIVAVHPRVCREHLAPWLSNHLCGGSSPRVQGTLVPRIRLR